MVIYYTVSEANNILPSLSKIVSYLVATHHRILELQPLIEGVLAKSGLNSGSKQASQMVMAFERFDDIMDNLRELGVQVKDAKTGLCDFLSLYPGREIYLCWQLGEESVSWWHELHGGFVGRRHVSELA